MHVKRKPMHVTELLKLKWIGGVAMLYAIRNEYIYRKIFKKTAWAGMAMSCVYDTRNI